MRMRRRAREEDPEINLISMIDVLLVLLIFFMISTTFQREARIRVELPRASETPVPGVREPLVVTVTAQGAYLVDGRELASERESTLRDALAQAGGTKHGSLLIRADARTTQQSVVTVMDVAGQLGFKQVDIATTRAAGAR
ncbi:MAG TPA: biopolymer transporter ExbD [Steroidobacteraceae bacterium]|nr:biopolymer transporter ExbD [Steroidobacteraceae bacterium]